MVPDMRTSLIAFLLVSVLPILSVSAEDWSIPLAGNTYRTAPEPGGRGLRRDNGLQWSATQDVWTVYFHVDRPATLQLSLVGKFEAPADLQVQVADATLKVSVPEATDGNVAVGNVQVAKDGYVKLDLSGTVRKGDTFGSLRQLLVQSETPDLKVDFVRNNDGNMFYWGRRGPSAHLNYTVPRDLSLEYAYTELTVPEGQDTIGSYFMANGFSEGYFGMQVNSSTERRILFSVWSPFNTDNPQDIPAEQRIRMLAKGPDVHVGEFGNEGSGGQSYLVYPWKAGTVCRFLTRVQPDKDGNTTTYTCWFSDAADGTWRLIASFRRPQTTTTLKGFHSFLENFDPSTGHITRRVHYGNVWVRDTSEQWHAVTKGRLGVDATGDQRHRLDFAGGAEGSHFFLQNCGFFTNAAKAGDRFEITGPAGQPPQLPATP